MYRGSSPIFDVPEFPSMRRVKPLPKRRRTSEIVTHIENEVVPSSPGILNADAATEDLIAQADSLSTQLALQSYYMPILGGVQSLFGNDIDNRTIDFGYNLGGQEDDHGDGDYIDHLQQPGNTKKRKVPANASLSQHGHDVGSGQSGEDEPVERGGLGEGRFDHDLADSFSSTPSSGMSGQRRGKLTPATLAGLQHKEMLKHRKRQLAAVLGAISHGDTLALDQALTSNYPFANMGLSADVKNEPPRVRLSRRKGPRLARAAKALVNLNASLPKSSSSPSKKTMFPVSDFLFVCHSATSDRLIATKEEVTLLRSRFEAELARQAAKATEAAAEARRAALAAATSTRAKGNRAQQRIRTAGMIGGNRGDEGAEFLDQALLGIKSRGSKKKKRSALAIASNPHHRRNYVPSRLPQSGQANPAQAALNAQNYLGPPPFRFLSAEIPSRRRKKSQAAAPTTQLTNPADEWICPFCEYELFYGNDADYRRAVRNRKKILRRRRRAERAAANVTAKVPERSTSTQDDEYDVGYEPSGADFASAAKQGRGKGEGEKGERGGDHLQTSFG